MSQGATSGATVIPAGGSQPVQLTTPATATALVIYTASTNGGAVYIGGSDVTSSNGLPVAANSYISIDVGDTGAVYLAGTQNDAVRWLATGRTVPA